ncbi:MAG: hypothetical protein IJ418_17510, partial [Clostridia bacterium]|nr:hypothetical protein [Clostridia bacterium]
CNEGFAADFCVFVKCFAQNRIEKDPDRVDSSFWIFDYPVAVIILMTLPEKEGFCLCIFKPPRSGEGVWG